MLELFNIIAVVKLVRFYRNSEFENPTELLHFSLYYCAINTTLTKDQRNVVIRGYSTHLLILELFSEIYRFLNVFCEKFPDLISVEANRLSLEHIDEIAGNSRSP